MSDQTTKLTNQQTNPMTIQVTDQLADQSILWLVGQAIEQPRLRATATPTIDRLPPSLLCFSWVHEVDDILDPVAVSVVLRVVGTK